MAWITQDLADITQLLITRFTEAINASPVHLRSPFPFEVTASIPPISGNEGKNTLSIALLQILPNPVASDLPAHTSGGQLQTPLSSLSISCLLTSRADTDWRVEQALMSIALAFVHAHPILTGPAGDLRLTLEVVSLGDLSRIWHAVAAPMRLSAVLEITGVSLISL